MTRTLWGTYKLIITNMSDEQEVPTDAVPTEEAAEVTPEATPAEEEAAQGEVEIV